jgi:TRAP-type C4-dicarboxylate transport system substrate-binding protein
MTRDKPVSSVADMEGLKLRTGGGMMEDVSQALGAVNVSAPAGQLYELVSSGVADGAFMGGEGYDSFGLKGLINYVTLVPGGLYASGWYVIMNKDSWAKISPEDQAAIMEVSGEKLAILAGSQFDAAEEAGREHMKQDGVNFTVADEAFMSEIEERTKFLEDEWLAAAAAEGVDGQAALDMFKKEAKDYEMAN